MLFFRKSSGMYGICCLYCLLSFYQSILSSQRRSVTSTSSGAESSVKVFFFHFAKIIIFSENLSFFCCFFSLFSLPWLSYSLPCLSHSVPRLSHSLPRLSHSIPRLSHSLPRLSHSLPWFCCHIPLSNVCPTHPTCRGRSFKKMPGVLKLLPLQGALLIALYPGRCHGLWASAPSGRAACAFCPANCFIPRVLPLGCELLPLQGVLLASFVLLIALYPGCCPGLWASALSGRAACVFCKKKAFTFWAFLSQRVHRFTPFVTFWWIPVKGGFTPWIPSVYRTFGADVKGEPSFLALYAYAKENK